MADMSTMSATPPLPSDDEDESPTPIWPPVMVVPPTPPQLTPSRPVPIVPQPVLAPPQMTPSPPPSSPRPPSPSQLVPVPRPPSPPTAASPERTPALPPPLPPLVPSPDLVSVPLSPPSPTHWDPSPSLSRPLPSPSPPPPPRSPMPHGQPHKTPASTPSSTSATNDISVTLSRNLPLTIGITAASVALLMLLIFGLIFWICTLKRKKQSSGANYQDHPLPLPPSHAHVVSIGHQSYCGSPKYPSNRLQAGPREVPMGNDHVPIVMASRGTVGVQPMGFWTPTPLLISTDMGNTSRSGSFKNGSGSFKHGSGSVRNGSGSVRNGGFSNHCSFPYDELAAATGGFGSGTVLGHGGFGYVHKGVLSNGKEVAVKCLKTGSRQGDREFQAEVEIISRVHHRHLVSLTGYCIEGGQRILVYEFVPNKTLEYHLHGKDRPCMDWSTRLRIALGAARGLAYLHEDCHPRIIHRDIKATNILLDMNFEAKVADFGLAKLTTDKYTHVSTRIMGTFGYLAPEYASSGKLTEKSDVYSFGVTLLELITGRRPFDATNKLMEDGLVDWARSEIVKAMEEGNFSRIADPVLEGNYVPQEMACMVACAGACIRHSAKLRPKMSQVVRLLEQDSAMEDLGDWTKLTEASRRSPSSNNDYESSSLDSMRRTPSRLALNSIGNIDNNKNNNHLDPSPSLSSVDHQSEEATRGKGSATVEK